MQPYQMQRHLDKTVPMGYSAPRPPLLADHPTRKLALHSGTWSVRAGQPGP
jgi:hypothetical protein